MAIGINQEGYRQILGVGLAGRESQTSWRDFLLTLKERGLHSVEFVVSDDCLQELRWLYDRRNLAEAQKDLSAWLMRWQGTYPRLCDWVEEDIFETPTFYRMPLGHHKKTSSEEDVVIPAVP